VLLAAEGRSTRSIAEEVGVQPRIVSNWRRRFADHGLAGLEDRPRGGKEPIYGQATNRRILALLDRPPPAGYARWTGPLLAKALQDVDVQYVWRFLREHKIDLAARKSWCESNEPGPGQRPGRGRLVVDGIDGRVHHMEFKDPSRIEQMGRDMIVEAAPVVSGPRPADRNIAANAAEDDGLYRPSRHLARIGDSFERQGKDPEAYVRSHVRRLETLRRAGQVERIDADHWKVPKDIVERGQAYDLSHGGDGLKVRTLSALSLDRQIDSDGATCSTARL
jgi:transposase